MMRPTIAKKRNFDGLHNHLKNYFETKFLVLVILMGSTITKKGYFNTLYNLLKKHFGIEFPSLVALVNYISDASPQPNLT